MQIVSVSLIKHLDSLELNLASKKCIHKKWMVLIVINCLRLKNNLFNVPRTFSRVGRELKNNSCTLLK